MSLDIVIGIPKGGILSSFEFKTRVVFIVSEKSPLALGYSSFCLIDKCFWF